MQDTEQDLKFKGRAYARLGIDLMTLLSPVVIAYFLYVEISILRARDALFDQLRLEHSVMLEAVRRCGP